MIFGALKRVSAALLLTTMVVGSAAANNFDYNDDGVIRVAWLSPAQHSGGIDSLQICADLEGMIKAAKPGMPVRVTPELLTDTRSIMGWCYTPDTQSVRTQLFDGAYDLILLAEQDEVVREYPEFFFEGVRKVCEAARAVKTRVAVVVMSRPATSFRDKRLNAVAETVYRVADGCGVEAVHAAAAWRETLARNRLSGDSPVKARACAWLTAATVFCQQTGSRIPKGALQSDWTTKRTTDALAQSAQEAVALERSVQHYVGPYSGVVRIEPHYEKRLKVYEPSTAEDDPLRANLQFVLKSAFHDLFWKTPSDWYSAGFDRYAAAFDLVYGSVSQMSLYLDSSQYTAQSSAPTNLASTCRVVYAPNPVDSQPDDTLRKLESILFTGYDFAKARQLIFVPYQLAWARTHLANPRLTATEKPGQVNDWLNYMLANMLYTVVTDRFQPPPESAKPRSVNRDHPHGYHEVCAHTGFEVMQQLSTLNEAVNALLLRTASWRIDANQPGFVGIRLLAKPQRETRVFCAVDLADQVELSRESLIFTPDNFNIEQTIRIRSLGEAPSLFVNFMASAQSEDKEIDGKGDRRPFLLNLDEREVGGMIFNSLELSPQNRFATLLRPSLRPCDTLCVRVVQGERVTQEVCFSPDNWQGSVVRLFPTAADHAKGMLKVTLQATSEDRRYNGREFDFIFRVGTAGAPLPTLAITAPASGAVIEGPAFVTARVEASGADIGETALYLGPKRLGSAAANACTAAVERGGPQSRLGGGEYTIWAAVTTRQGVTVATAPLRFTVQESLTLPTPPLQNGQATD